jgi:hypothetical protein
MRQKEPAALRSNGGLPVLRPRLFGAQDGGPWKTGLADLVDHQRVAVVRLFGAMELRLIGIGGHDGKTDGADGIVASGRVAPVGKRNGRRRLHPAPPDLATDSFDAGDYRIANTARCSRLLTSASRIALRGRDGDGDFSGQACLAPREQAAGRSEPGNLEISATHLSRRGSYLT